MDPGTSAKVTGLALTTMRAERSRWSSRCSHKYVWIASECHRPKRIMRGNSTPSVEKGRDTAPADGVPVDFGRVITARFGRGANKPDDFIAPDHAAVFFAEEWEVCLLLPSMRETTLQFCQCAHGAEVVS